MPYTSFECVWYMLTAPQPAEFGPKKPVRESRTVQQHVEGEASRSEFGFSSFGPSVGQIDNPEASTSTMEPQLTDKTELAEGIQAGEFKPVPTVQQRRYSVDWDPRR